MMESVGSDGKTYTYKGTTSTEINQALGHSGVTKGRGLLAVPPRSLR